MLFIIFYASWNSGIVSIPCMDIQQYANPFLALSQQTPAHTTLSRQVLFFPLNPEAGLLGCNEKYLLTDGLSCKLSINTILSNIQISSPKLLNTAPIKTETWKFLLSHLVNLAQENTYKKVHFKSLPNLKKSDYKIEEAE